MILCCMPSPLDRASMRVSRSRLLLVGEFKTVVRLDARHGNAFTGKIRNDPAQKIRREKGALFLVSAQNAVTEILVHGGVLV